MKTICSVLVLSTFAVSLTANAAWVTGQTLTQVGSGDVGGEYIWFTTSQPVNNPAGCANSDLYVLRSLPRNALAILLTAHAADKPIRLFVNPSQCDASTGRPLVTDVGIQS